MLFGQQSLSFAEFDEAANRVAHVLRGLGVRPGDRVGLLLGNTNLVSPTRDSVTMHAASLIHASGTFVLPYWVRGGAAAIPKSAVGKILRRALRDPL